MAIMPRPTLQCSAARYLPVPRCVSQRRSDPGTHCALASYLGRLARRRVNRRGFGPSALESARQTAVAR